MSSSNKPFMNWNAGDLAKEWRRFKQHCMFTFDGPLSDKTEKAKVNYLMTYVGDKGREVYGTFVWPAGPLADGQAEEKDTLIGVYTRFDQYVAPKSNHIRATVAFNRRKQSETETFENFVTDLKILVKDCGFTEEDRMVRDGVVLRSFHEAVQEKCVDQGDTLTLEKAIEVGRNYEMQLASMKAIRGEDQNQAGAHALSDMSRRTRYKKRDSRRPKTNRKSERRSSERRKGSQKKCTKCGYGQHSRDDTCPAIGRTCDYCKKENHFATVCRKKKANNDNDESTNQVDESTYEYEDSTDYSDYSDDDDLYIHPVYAVDGNTQEYDQWYETVQVRGKKLRMQLDTGSKQCTLPYSMYQSLGKKPPLQKSTQRLISYSGQQLDIKGKVTLPLKYKNSKCEATFYVVNTSGKPPLLSGEICSQLGLIKRTHNVEFHKETMKPTPLPDLPWMEVASDIFDWEGEQYLLTIDYYSRYIEVDKLPDMSSSATIECLKAQFARHGIPEKLRSDNGPQYSSREFRDFCKEYGIEHTTSSPLYPQSHGEAERAVETVKRMWRKCKDKHLALLNYRTTQLKGLSFSPAQLLMSRRPRNKVTAARLVSQPKTVDIKDLKQSAAKEKATQQKYYDRKAGQDLPALKPGDPVRMSPLPGFKQWLPATVLEHHSTPRSYVVEYHGRKYRRNRRNLRLSTHNPNKAQRVP